MLLSSCSSSNRSFCGRDLQGLPLHRFPVHRIRPAIAPVPKRSTTFSGRRDVSPCHCLSSNGRYDLIIGSLVQLSPSGVPRRIHAVQAPKSRKVLATGGTSVHLNACCLTNLKGPALTSNQTLLCISRDLHTIVSRDSLLPDHSGGRTWRILLN